MREQWPNSGRSNSGVVRLRWCRCVLGEQRKGEVPGLVVCSDGSGDWEVTLVVVRGIAAAPTHCSHRMRPRR